ncbi:MAG TPA: hypothetical protein VF756_09360 [Thermoanaerobaculia bacterium]
MKRPVRKSPPKRRRKPAPSGEPQRTAPRLVSQAVEDPGTWSGVQLCFREFASARDTAAFLGLAFAAALERGQPLEAHIRDGHVVVITHGPLHSGPDGQLTGPSLGLAAEIS